MVNAIIIFLFFLLFLWLGDFLLFVLQKITRKKIDKSISFLFSLVVTLLYLGHGYFLAHHVVATSYKIEATKDIGVENFRIVQITDSHIGATMDGDDFIAYMEEINRTNPDIVVVTGDFVDDDTSLTDMEKGCLGLGKLKTKYGVYFVYGNHDKGYFQYRSYDNERLREELLKNHVVILEDQSVELSDKIVLLGRQDAQTKDRLKAEELMQSIPSEKYTIVLDHEPTDYEAEASSGMDLVLSGHTHGGQFFPIGQLSVLLGINDNDYGLQKRKNTTFLVSSGIGDWAIQFKTGTISEYVIIDLQNKK